MGLLNRVLIFTAKSILMAADLDAEIDNIINWANGNVDTDNLADGAVTNAKLGAGRVAVDASQTAYTLVHAATTRYFVVNAGKGKVSDGTGAGNTPYISELEVRPDAADNAYKYAYIPVELGIGATITKITIYGYTGSGLNNIVEVKWYGGTNTTAIGNLLATTSFSNGATTSNTTTIGSPIINSGTRYWLLIAVKSDTAVTDARLYAIVLDYTTTNIGQLI